MMISFNNDDVTGLEREQQQEPRTLPSRPQTVSSFSSIDTTGYEQNDIVLDPNFIQQSAPPPLHPVIENSGSSTVITASTAVSSADPNFGLTSNTTFIAGTVPAGGLEPDSSPSPNLAGSGSMRISSSTGVLVASTPNTNTVPEFLYQLTKMLTDNNRDIIEWSNGM